METKYNKLYQNVWRAAVYHRYVVFFSVICVHYWNSYLIFELSTGKKGAKHEEKWESPKWKKNAIVSVYMCHRCSYLSPASILFHFHTWAICCKRGKSSFFSVSAWLCIFTNSFIPIVFFPICFTFVLHTHSTFGCFSLCITYVAYAIWIMQTYTYTCILWVMSLGFPFRTKFENDKICWQF